MEQRCKTLSIMRNNIIKDAAKYRKMVAINTLINDKARKNFYKPSHSLVIYQKSVKRIVTL